MITNTHTIPYEDLVEAINESGCDIYDEIDRVIRTDYSGRAMYGSSCFGLVLQDAGEVASVLVTLSHLEGYDRWDVQELARSMRTDNMGLSTIFYFPGWTLTGAPEDDDDEC